MPRYRIVIEQQARIDIQEAIIWYNIQIPGLGKKFLNNVSGRFKHLQKFPMLLLNISTLEPLLFPHFPII